MVRGRGTTLSKGYHVEEVPSPVPLTSTKGVHSSSDVEGPVTVTRLRDRNQAIPAPDDPADKQRIEIEDNSFADIDVTRAIMTTMKSFFSGPWPSWKRVPSELKNFLWDKFQEKYTWDANMNANVRKVWEKTSSRQFSGMLHQAQQEAMRKAQTDNILHTKGFGPSWMTTKVWNALVDEHWIDDKWKKDSQMRHQNHLSEVDVDISKHARGSSPFVMHKKRTVKDLDMSITQLELFECMLKREGGEGSFVDKKSKKEKYTDALEDKYDPESLSPPQFDTKAWAEATEGPSHDRLYEFGLSEDLISSIGTLSTSFSHISNGGCGGASSSHQVHTEENFLEMQKKVQRMEKDLQEMTEMLQTRRQEALDEMQADIDREVEQNVHCILIEFGLTPRPPPSSGDAS